MINIKKLLGLEYYTSELDQFLADFDGTHTKLSASQRMEKAKYARIYQLRDNFDQQSPVGSLWDNF